MWGTRQNPGGWAGGAAERVGLRFCAGGQSYPLPAPPRRAAAPLLPGRVSRAARTCSPHADRSSRWCCSSCASVVQFALINRPRRSTRRAAGEHSSQHRRAHRLLTNQSGPRQHFGPGLVDLRAFVRRHNLRARQLRTPDPTTAPKNTQPAAWKWTREDPTAGVGLLAAGKAPYLDANRGGGVVFAPSQQLAFDSSVGFLSAPSAAGLSAANSNVGVYSVVGGCPRCDQAVVVQGGTALA